MDKITGATSHHEAELAELRANPKLVAAYRQAAQEALADPQTRVGALLALQTLAEACGRPGKSGRG